MVENILLGPGLLQHLSGKGDWVGGGENDVVTAEARARGSRDVIKLAGLAVHVVIGVAGGNVHVARAAFQTGVAGGGGFSGSPVVGHGVAVKYIVAGLDLHFTA